MRILFLIAVLLLASMTSLHASKRILVDLTHQIAIAYQDGQVRFFGRISSGKPGRETPAGSFHVLEKDIDHVSNLWPQPDGGAEMRYMLRVTRDGVAMHLGNTPDYPASHGCIRMQDGFAQKMFAWAQKWTRIDVVGKAPAHSPAVALPAYAVNSSMLRRSIGGGTGSPLDIISSNPKKNGTVPDRPIVIGNDDASATPKYTPHHVRPLDIISSNYKRHNQTAHTPPSSPAKKSRKPKPPRNHHPDPLKTISGQ